MRKLNYTQLALIFVAAFVVFPLGRNITYGTAWSEHEYAMLLKGSTGPNTSTGFAFRLERTVFGGGYAQNNRMGSKQPYSLTMPLMD